MKFTYREYDNEQDPSEFHEYKFLRTLGTEKSFRDNTNAEMNAQLATLMDIQMNLEQKKDRDSMKARLDLEFDNTRHEVLKFMYAETDGNSLIQNETTRAHFDSLDIDEQACLNLFFQHI